MKKRYIWTPILIGVLSVSSYSVFRIKTLENENKSLKTKIDEKDSKSSDYKVTVGDIKEINKDNIDLIVYESDYVDYKLNSNDDTFMIGIDASVTTRFKYKVVTDLSKCKISKTNDLILVHVKEKDLKLKEIIVERPDLEYDTNIISGLRGTKIIETESDLLIKSYKDIDRIVNREYKLNKELFKMNLINKMEKLYNSQDVKVIID